MIDNGYGTLAAPMSKAEQYTLITQAQAGDLAARNLIVEKNMRLVCAVARRAMVQIREEDRPDLIQEGVFGLIHAIGKFDLARQLSFSTYAVSWIRQAINRALVGYTSPVILPEYAWQARKKLHRILEQQPDATPEQLAERTGLAVEQTSRLLFWMSPPLSLDLAAFPGASETFLDTLEDTGDYTQHVVESDEQRDLVAQCLALVSERERLVLERYFGLAGQEAMDFREIGEMIGLSRQRAHQYYQQAIKKIREGLGVKPSQEVAA